MSESVPVVLALAADDARDAAAAVAAGRERLSDLPNEKVVNLSIRSAAVVSLSSLKDDVGAPPFSFREANEKVLRAVE